MLSRREFLRAGSAVALGAALASCKSAKPVSKGTLKEIIAGRPNSLSIVAVQGEVLKGENVRYPFALFDIKTNQRYTAGSVRLWVGQDQAKVPAGPFEATWHEEMLGDRGIYVAHLPFPTDGSWLLLAEASPSEATNRKLIGGTAVGVGRRIEQPAPGDKAIVVVSPTTANHRGVEPICTKRPACSMHDISLDAALKSGRPTVVVLGTPAFCQSKTCGPVVTILDTVKSRTPKGSVNFVHVELYADDTNAPAKGILAPAAAAWKITEEPVVYFVKPDGTIAERFVGAAGLDEVAAQTQALR